MLINLQPGDEVAVTLAGVTHKFGADRITLKRVESAPKAGRTVRYLTATVVLGDEFPETTDHVA